MKVSYLVLQINTLRQLQKFGTATEYKRPLDKKSYELSILVFSDASKSNDSGQLGCIAGLLIGHFQQGSIFHGLHWTSNKSKRPVRSTAGAELLAAGYSIDEGKILRNVYQDVLGISVNLDNVVDSTDLWTTLSTCRDSLDKSIRGNDGRIRCEFETKQVSKMIWVPGTVNLSDPVTKPNSPLCSTLQLMLFSGEIPISFDQAQERDSSATTG